MYKIRGALLGAGVIGLTFLSLAVQPTKTQMEPVVTVEPQRSRRAARVSHQPTRASRWFKAFADNCYLTIGGRIAVSCCSSPVC